MKYTITIEETVTKDFEIEANSSDEAYEIAEHKYYRIEFGLDVVSTSGVVLHIDINYLSKDAIVSIT